MCIDFHAMAATNHAANEALEMLKRALTTVSTGWLMEPGDLIIIDNRLSAHARLPFQPRYDGNDRWLQRLFIVQNFRQSLASRYRHSHICAPLSVELFDMQTVSGHDESADSDAEADETSADSHRITAKPSEVRAD
jgi:L-asparagine oxygenase